MTQELGPGAKMPEITDEQLVQAQGAVRYQQIMRYERMWHIVERRIQEEEAGDRPLDARILEIGIRVLKEEAALYRLGRPAVLIEEDEDPALQGGVDRGALVLAQLEDVEARLRAQEEAHSAGNGSRQKQQEAA